jgi:hypothetical protein
MISFSNKGRAKFLISAGTAMTATLIATAAHAADTTVAPAAVPPPFATTTVNAHTIIGDTLQNTGPISAPITDTEGGEEHTIAPGDTVSYTVDHNDTTATANGNEFDYDIDLLAIDNTGPIDDGAASAGVRLNLAPVSAFVGDGVDLDDEGNGISLLVDDFSLGSLAVEANIIEAVANGSRGTSTLAGEIPNDYASTAAGFSEMNTDVPGGNWLEATGSLLASTVQIQADTVAPISTTATASTNNILLEVLNTEDDAEVVGSPRLEDNTIAATVAGNRSTSEIDIQAGGATAFIGTAAVTNGQINAGTVNAGAIVATNEDSDIIATIAADDVNSTDDAELQGSLSVAGNAITASASGNRATGSAPGEAGNTIQLANGMSFDGSANTLSPGTDIAYDAGALTSTVNADIIIHNSQGNTGEDADNRLAVTASADDGEIAAIVDDISAGSVKVTGNAITGSASGNAASSVFATGTGMADFAGSAALASQQVDFYTNVLGEATGDIYAAVADDDDLDQSTVTVGGNTVGASAYGNSVSQSLTVGAVGQDLPLTGVTLTGGTDGANDDGNVASDGSLTVTNLQAVYSGDVDAREVHNIFASASTAGDTVGESTVKVTGNTGEAVSVGNNATNTLALSGATVGGGAGIASVQINDDDDGDDIDETDGTASSTGIVQIDTDAVDQSRLELSGNLQRGIAYGGSATNTLTVAAETITADGDIDGIASTVTASDTDFVFTSDPQPDVEAAYAVLNVQSLNGQIAAEALPAGWTGLDASFAVTVDGDVTDSTIANDGNTLVAAAYGADATNTATLDVGTLDTDNGDFASVLNLTNVQEVTENSVITAQAAGVAAVYTEISGDNDIENSSISTSLNTIQALVYGNRADNEVTATGTGIDTEADAFPAGIQGEAQIAGGVATTEASFSLNNAQSAGGVMTASLLDDLDPDDATTSVAIFTVIGDDVIDSSIASDGNTLSASATANRADNWLEVSGNALATTAALTNFQLDPTDISAFIGIEGGAPTPFIPGEPADDFGFTVTGTGLVHDNVNNDFDAGTLYIDTTSLAANEIAFLMTQGWSDGGLNTLTRSAVDWPATIGDYSLIAGEGLGYNDTVPATSNTPASPGTPNIGGVTVAIGGDIDPSSVSVSNNNVSGSVTGNSASNTVVLSGTDVIDGSDHLLSYATADGQDTQADGDAMLANLQVVTEDSDINSEVYNTFAIDAEDDVLLLDSSLEVDGNSQSSRAVANTATNSVTVEATNLAAGSALASNQTSAADVSATSGVDIFAPVASDGSSISMSDNSNLAVAVINNAANTLTVDVTNAVPVGVAIDALADVDTDAVAFGDHVLTNQQVASTAATASAVTQIYNDDVTDPDTAGIYGGSVTIEGNSTTAEASANRATNIANIGAGSSLNAAAGVTNSQVSSAVVESSATTNAGITLAADSTLPADALNGGSIMLGGNTTTALARGNAATNSLNYEAGADYGVGTGDAGTSSIDLLGVATDASASARAAVLNAQVNTGSVSASSSDGSYMVALNSDEDFGGITNGTIGVIGNVVSAAAYGNTSTNMIAVNALNTAMPTTAVANYQSNSGAVTASVTSVTYGISSGLGAITGSSLAVSGNSITATAVGNSAVASITTN